MDVVLSSPDHAKESSLGNGFQDFGFVDRTLWCRWFLGVAEGLQLGITAHVISKMTLPVFDDFIRLCLDERGGLDVLGALDLSPFSPLLIFNVLGHPAVVTVPITPVELIDGIGVGAVTVDVIRSDLCGPDLASVIKLEMKDTYQHALTACFRDDIDPELFPSSCCSKNIKYDKRTPGLFKVEYEGDVMVGLCSNTYIVQTNRWSTLPAQR